MIRKGLIALTTGAWVVGVAVTAADAQGHAERQFFRALGIGAGVVAGALLFGAAARAALDPHYQAYAPVEGYYFVEGPGYAAPPPIACPNGFWAYRVNTYGQPYGSPRWVCPPQGYYAYSYGWR
jgi:hypothetical protein